VEADDGQPDLNSFAAGIRNDLQAVTNGLTLPYSSGKVEGSVRIRVRSPTARCQADYPCRVPRRLPASTIM